MAPRKKSTVSRKKPTMAATKKRAAANKGRSTKAKAVKKQAKRGAKSVSKTAVGTVENAEVVGVERAEKSTFCSLACAMKFFREKELAEKEAMTARFDFIGRNISLRHSSESSALQQEEEEEPIWTFDQLCEEAVKVFERNGIISNRSPRTLLLRLCILLGDIASIVHDAEPSFSESSKGRIKLYVVEMFVMLCVAAKACTVDLSSAFSFKMELNKKKHPVELCKGSHAKCTTCSDVTGIGERENKFIMSCAIGNNCGPTFVAHAGEIIKMVEKFSAERQWNDCHTPRNLIFALHVELSELMEIFQWKEDSVTMEHLTTEEKCHVASEFADVLVCLFRLIHLCAMNIEKEVAALKTWL